MPGAGVAVAVGRAALFLTSAVWGVLAFDLYMIAQGPYIPSSPDANEQQRFNNDPNLNQNGKISPGSDASEKACKAEDIATQLEQLGGGKPRIVPTNKGAAQFIFPNGTVLRFDLYPGQYLPGQTPHINLETPRPGGGPRRNEHIPVIDKK